MIVSDPTARKMLEALLAAKTSDDLQIGTETGGAASPGQSAAVDSDSAEAMQKKFGMVDILDDSILNARQGDGAFPVRLMFGEMVSHGDDDAAFAFACGLNFYFRAAMEEESKVRVALAVSRLYYDFGAKLLDAKLVRALSPLLAQLMSTELSTLELRSVDDASMFDSAMHERAKGSDETSARIRRPASFLCRVTATKKTRFKATVRT